MDYTDSEATDDDTSSSVGNASDAGEEPEESPPASPHSRAHADDGFQCQNLVFWTPRGKCLGETWNLDDIPSSGRGAVIKKYLGTSRLKGYANECCKASATQKQILKRDANVNVRMAAVMFKNHQHPAIVGFLLNNRQNEDMTIFDINTGHVHNMGREKNPHNILVLRGFGAHINAFKAKDADAVALTGVATTPYLYGHVTARLNDPVVTFTYRSKDNKLYAINLPKDFVARVHSHESSHKPLVVPESPPLAPPLHPPPPSPQPPFSSWLTVPEKNHPDVREMKEGFEDISHFQGVCNEEQREYVNGLLQSGIDVKWAKMKLPAACWEKVNRILPARQRRVACWKTLMRHTKPHTDKHWEGHEAMYGEWLETALIHDAEEQNTREEDENVKTCLQLLGDVDEKLQNTIDDIRDEFQDSHSRPIDLENQKDQKDQKDQSSSEMVQARAAAAAKKKEIYEAKLQKVDEAWKEMENLGKPGNFGITSWVFGAWRGRTPKTLGRAIDI